ncbi:uncharacterized protein EV422DRAFT_46130 [Fimicolochytrium jonesii]|uniref:uncharacterized protein n=1 Tax=Fimicolochytrium jonesii TaxID=1396493 RepID=UPI0022FF3AB5|nr:uncharacterized protein EV422DRAFT_46130 [Fimicolochytrium jonesii]KAI8820948.1 hypothetical protein EV422DRAFT_46130 [Fimicolochytrium jonesii]
MPSQDGWELTLSDWGTDLGLGRLLKTLGPDEARWPNLRSLGLRIATVALSLCYDDEFDEFNYLEKPGGYKFMDPLPAGETYADIDSDSDSNGEPEPYDSAWLSDMKTTFETETPGDGTLDREWRRRPIPLPPGYDMLLPDEIKTAHNLPLSSTVDPATYERLTDILGQQIVEQNWSFADADAMDWASTEPEIPRVCGATPMQLASRFPPGHVEFDVVNAKVLQLWERDAMDRESGPNHSSDVDGALTGGLLANFLISPVRWK